jgi:two-component system LytT family response regulator
MRVIIIDDQQSCHDEIMALLATTQPKLQLVGEAYNVRDGVALIRATQPDLIFLDIEMPDGTGFDLLGQIEHSRYAIVFVTAHNDFATLAFDFSALAYILKPIEADELQLAVARAEDRNRIRSLEERVLELTEVIANYQEKTLPRNLIITNAEGTYPIPVDKIEYLYVADGCTEIYYYDKQRVIVARNLIEFERHFKAYSYFLKIHSSTIVNLHFIQRIAGSDVILTTGKKLAVSRRNMPALKEAIGHF